MRIFLLPFIIGFAALLSQVVYMRELTVVFYGNELAFSAIMANWLLFGGLGGFLGAFLNRKLPQVRQITGFFFFALSGLLPAMLFFIRISRNVLNIPQGEVIGLSQIYWISFLTLSAPSLCLGLLFTLTVELLRRQSHGTKRIPTYGYIMEGVGAAVAGFVLTWLFVRNFDSFQITCFTAGLGFLGGSIVWFGLKLGVPLGIAATILLTHWAPPIQDLSLKMQWSDFKILESTNTPYGNLVVAKREGQINFFENGFLIGSLPDYQECESVVHPPLLLHPDPATVLLIGETSPEYLREILKHPVRLLEATELDWEWIDLKQKYSKIRTDNLPPKFTFIYGDGRRYLKKSPRQFDVIILALPEPDTLLINRYYTVEFFKEAGKHLGENGLLALRLPGMANYPSRELAELIQSIKKSLSHVFPQVIVLPMQSTHLIATGQREPLQHSAADFIQVLEEREIETRFFNENYIPYYLTRDRARQLATALEKNDVVEDNHDFRPSAQFYATFYWSAYASPRFKDVLRAMMDVPQAGLFMLPFVWLIVLTALRHKTYFKEISILNSMGWTGFSEIGFEMILILAYQAIYGYAYLWIAVIFGSFMTGLVLGSLLTLTIRVHGRKLFRRLEDVQFWIVFYPLLLILILIIVQHREIAFIPAVQYGFPFLAIIAGFFGGLQFPLAQRIFAEGKKDNAHSTGLVYGIDLLGSCLGALLIVSIMVPAFGLIRVSAVIALINLTSWWILKLEEKSVEAFLE